jgi:hypothetical protein
MGTLPLKMTAANHNLNIVDGKNPIERAVVRNGGLINLAATDKRA